MREGRALKCAVCTVALLQVLLFCLSCAVRKGLTVTAANRSTSHHDPHSSGIIGCLYYVGSQCVHFNQASILKLKSKLLYYYQHYDTNLQVESSCSAWKSPVSHTGVALLCLTAQAIELAYSALRICLLLFRKDGSLFALVMIALFWAACYNNDNECWQQQRHHESTFLLLMMGVISILSLRFMQNRGDAQLIGLYNVTSGTLSLPLVGCLCLLLLSSSTHGETYARGLCLSYVGLMSAGGVLIWAPQPAVAYYCCWVLYLPFALFSAHCLAHARTEEVRLLMAAMVLVLLWFALVLLAWTTTCRCRCGVCLFLCHYSAYGVVIACLMMWLHDEGGRSGS